MIWRFIVLGTLILMMGCPSSIEGHLEDINIYVRKHSLDNTTKIETQIFSLDNLHDLGIALHIFLNDEGIQNNRVLLHVQKRVYREERYNKVISWKEQKKFDIYKISNTLSKGRVWENILIQIPYDYFKTRAGRDMVFQVSGKNSSFIFTLPENLSAGFQSKLAIYLAKEQIVLSSELE